MTAHPLSRCAKLLMFGWLQVIEFNVAVPDAIST